MKRGFDDGLFSESTRSLAEIESGVAVASEDKADDEFDPTWDEEDPLNQ